MSRLTTNFNLFFIIVNNVLTKLRHSEYSKCPVARMQARRRLRHWSMPTLCYTPTRTSIRCHLKSFLSCAFVWQTWCPRFCNQLRWDHGRSVATNLEVCMSD